MYLREVKVWNFRNLERVHLTLEERCIFILGDNAQGKSNFLEALFLLARGYSPQGARGEEMIRFGEEIASVSAKIVEEGEYFVKEVILRRNGSREWRLNGKRERKWEPIWLVGYFPEDFAIVGGAPKDRRDFLNQAISLVYPPYDRFLKSYEKIVERRNLLLREGGPEELLPVYTEKMINLGSQIVEWRVQYLRTFTPILSEVYRMIFGEGELEVQYESLGYRWEEGIGEGLRKAHRELEREEFVRGMTLFGPHRDEITLLLRGKEVRDFASQGEKKGIALSLRLAEMRMIKRMKKSRVILLLDDLFSEFDTQRRELILRGVNGEGQVFVTTTEREMTQKAVREFSALVLFMTAGKMSQRSQGFL